MKIKFYALCMWLIVTTNTYSQDVMINEIMANPKNGELPAVEYIELMNNSTSVQDLGKLSLNINKKNLQIPTYLLAPQQFVILCAQDGEEQLAIYGNVIPLVNWPQLNNSGATIQLYRGNTLLDEVVYKDSWHQNSSKKSGGWSLERINPNWTCNMKSNWSSSIARKGGTPGSPNSITDKTYLPKVAIAQMEILEKAIRMRFNIERQFLPEFQKEDFSIDHGVNTPVSISWMEDSDFLLLNFDQTINPQEIYTLTVNEIELCGQLLQVPEYLLFDQPQVRYNDIVINEILFNPQKEGSDFIEIYNRTDLPINLQGWLLGNRTISDELLLLESQDFLVLTAEKEKIIRTHANAVVDRVYEMTSLPAYPNQQGVVTLYSPGGLVDSVYYHAAMHSSWIKNPKGISLERQSYEEDSNLPENFKSAATIAGGSTPGFRNSTHTDNPNKKIDLFLTSKTVSPDDDGFEDELEINYRLNGADYMLNLNIYAEKGTLVNRLIQQQSVGFDGKIKWDCRDENTQKAAPGHYIYWAEIYRENGFREIFKGAFVIVHKSHQY
ncbi:lamin tail domain-containing protein [Sphingobacterium paucimobilis]|nr:lamin tail domain-containing protein [Sphingobacterium paucimobilis]